MFIHESCITDHAAVLSNKRDTTTQEGCGIKPLLKEGAAGMEANHQNIFLHHYIYYLCHCSNVELTFSFASSHCVAIIFFNTCTQISALSVLMLDICVTSRAERAGLACVILCKSFVMFLHWFMSNKYNNLLLQLFTCVTFYAALNCF